MYCNDKWWRYIHEYSEITILHFVLNYKKKIQYFQLQWKCKRIFSVSVQHLFGALAHVSHLEHTSNNGFFCPCSPCPVFKLFINSLFDSWMQWVIVGPDIFLELYRFQSLYSLKCLRYIFGDKDETSVIINTFLVQSIIITM